MASRDLIPREIRKQLDEYRDGRHPYPFGSFLTAVLANDLVAAFMSADMNNTAIMKAYATYLYNDMPGRTGDPNVDIWGSYEAVENTIRRRQETGVEV